MRHFLNIASIFAMILVAFMFSCTSRTDESIVYSADVSDGNKNSIFYYGADLSYVNEMEDCGAIYKDAESKVKDVYQIFSDEGANIVRLRLWHNPDWTNYSNLADVKKAIRRAKNQNLKVLLDFHYSDTWADPGKQEIPAAWVSSINDTAKLSQLLYQYTYDTLKELDQEGLTPDIVQVGNEINAMMLQQGKLVWPIDWTRNAAIINKGIQAVRNISKETEKDIEVMLHIAQPENALSWFWSATQNGVTDFDWIGLSYYPQHSKYTLENIDKPLSSLINTHNKKLMIVETGYPFTLDNADAAANVLGSDALVPGFPATQKGQLDFLSALTTKTKAADGSGIIYWEPAWVSTNCKTRWATGSHWDNATLFDADGKVNLGIKFYNKSIKP